MNSATALEATFNYVLALKKLGYSKEAIDRAFRAVSHSDQTETEFRAALVEDLKARQGQKQVRV